MRGSIAILGVLYTLSACDEPTSHPPDLLGNDTWSVPSDAAPEVDLSTAPDTARETSDTTTTPPLLTDLCQNLSLEPWSQGLDEAGGTVSFNEIMYHAEALTELEWVELHNTLSIDVDLSGWRLSGGIDFTFPNDTFLPARSYLVVAANPTLLARETGFEEALGAFQGKLSNSGERLELRNNRDRIMDVLDYRDHTPWPTPPDGTGATLAKRHPLTTSGAAESWTFSPQPSGTPGQENFPQPSPTLVTLVGEEATWGWNTTGFEAPTWEEAVGDFFAGSSSVDITALLSADNHFAYYLGPREGDGLRLIGRDNAGDWQSAETFQSTATPSDHLYIAGWEAPGDSASPQMVIGHFDLGGGTRSTSSVDFEAILGPANTNPGGALTDPAPSPALLALEIQAANAANTWAPPAVERAPSAAPWGFALGNVFGGDARYIWIDTLDPASQTNTLETWALFRSTEPVGSNTQATELPAGPVTTYFRTTFELADATAVTSLQLNARIDDGAAFYLNNVEVYRHNLPTGPMSSDTLALRSVDPPDTLRYIPLDTTPLLPGTNTLTVEVHQATLNDPDMAFGATLRARLSPASESVSTLAFSEVASGRSASAFWVELGHADPEPLQLEGYTIRSSEGMSYTFPAQVLAPGELLLLDRDTLGFGATEGHRLVLLSPEGAILDALRVDVTVRARLAPGPTRWLYPDVATPGAPNIVPLNDAVVINEIMYHPDDAEPEWLELYNRSTTTVELGGWQLVEGVRFEFPAGTRIEPQGYLVVTGNAAAAQMPGVEVIGDFEGRMSNSGEGVELRDACGNPVDRVRYSDSGRWPGLADGGGSSLERRSPRSSSNSPEHWASSDESGRATWQSFAYRGVAQPSAANDDSWSELVLGLLDEGELLIDDLHVVEDPDGASRELLEDGSFDSGVAQGWRILGNHLGEVVEDPEDPSNRVLRLRASGPTGHMHNHAETTLQARVQNGTEYEIAFRARWVSGSNQLNTRLYFNRLARTTRIETPSGAGTPGGPNSTRVDNTGPAMDGMKHAPLVPLPGEPVTVEIEASDLDGIQGVALHHAVDGAPFETTPMLDLGEGRFSVQVPGQPDGAVVHFYVEAEDALGASATFPSAGAQSRALWRVEGAPSGEGPLRPLRIVMTEADSTRLHAEVNLMSNGKLGATVIDGVQCFYDVGVRLKGSQRGRPTEARLGYGLYFGRDQPFRGVYRSVLVDRSEGVGFGQREMLINQVLARGGSVSSEYNDLVHLIAPRSAYTGPAELQLARFTNLMLEHQFEQGDEGMLFEYELIYYPTITDDGTPQGYKRPQPDRVVGTPITDLGDDKEDYRHHFLIKSNRDRDDYQRLMTFARLFGQGSPEFLVGVDAIIDVDQWLRAFAFATLSGAVDQYGFGSQHNAQFYIRPSDQRVLYFPHDLDFFAPTPFNPIVANSDLSRLLASPANARLFYGHLLDIIETTYNDRYMAYWRDHFAALLPEQRFADHHQFLVQRAEYVLRGAPDSVMNAIGPVPFTITSNGGQDFRVFSSTAVVEGEGWIDVREIWWDGLPIEVRWLDETTWTTSVALSCGPNVIALEARNHQGELVGRSEVTITSEATGCP